MAADGKQQLTGYSTAVIGLIVAFVTLSLLSFIAYAIWQMVSNRPD